VSEGPTGRLTARWLFGVGLAVATAVLLVTLSLAQASEEAAAKRSLARSVAILAEVDAFLEDRLDALRQEAEASENGLVEISDFPVVIVVPADGLLNEDEAAVRALLLRAAADRIYEEGPSAFRDDASGDPSLVSRERAIDESMDLFRPDTHDALFLVAAISAGVTVVLALALLLVSPLHRGLVLVGMSVAAGTIPVLLVSGLLWLAARSGADGSGDYLAAEYLELVEALILAPLRNGLVFLASAVCLALLGLVLTPRRRRADPEPEPVIA
jgi:hypothetical protein